MFLLITDLFFFAAVFFGPALAAQRWIPRIDPVERIALALGAALIVVHLTTFGLYLAGWSLRWALLVPVAAWLVVLFRPTPPARAGQIGGWWWPWLGLVGWTLGWQATVISYSGALWCNDWIEHYDRVHFFLARWPEDFRFLDLYPLPARPPLANLNAAALMAWRGGAFAHFQVFTTLFGCLVYFPLMALIRIHGGQRRHEILLLGLLMLNPLFVQNATFPWTKLTAAFFVLLAVTQLLPRDREEAGSRWLCGALMLAGGMLAHYSTEPWVLALGAAWVWTEREKWRTPRHRWQAVRAVAAAALVLATWVAWSMSRYGVRPTFDASNAGVPPAQSWLEPLRTGATNLAATLSLWSEPPASHGLAWIREYWFALYQLKLPWALGVAGLPLLAWQLARLRRSPTTEFWLIAAPSAVILGTLVHLRPDDQGLVHICLTPLVLLGLAWLALGAGALPGWLQRLWRAGLVADFLFGIGLHFALQAFWPQKLLGAAGGIAEYLWDYPYAARANWMSKVNLHLQFLADTIPAWLGPCLIAASATIVVRLWREIPRGERNFSAGDGGPEY